MKLRQGDALLVVDVQKDFLPGGSLAVPGGDAVIAPLNRAIRVFEEAGLPVFAGRDWHPRDHCSFHRQGGPWPPHCVAETFGAEFSSELELPSWIRVFSKATRKDREAYSAFDGTCLAEGLRSAGVDRIFIGGLTTEYCVLESVADARRLGFEVRVLEDAIQGFGAQPGDIARAMSRIEELGARWVRSSELELSLRRAA